MTNQKEMVAVKAGPDDNLTNENVEAGRSACPGNNPFIELPSKVNGINTKTKWWINYWWGQNEWKTGTYVWGGNNKNMPDFYSDFDPKKFFEQDSTGAVKLKVYWDKDRKNPGTGQPDPMWITSELVLASIEGSDYNKQGEQGHYAVVAQAPDFGNIDAWATLGIFTYQFGANPGNNPHRELDLLETISTAQQGLHGNAQFAVQTASNSPTPEGTNMLRFSIPRSTPLITAYMYWGDPRQRQATNFKLFAGDHTIADITKPGSTLKPMVEWDITHEDKDHTWYQFIPFSNKQRMHINFYVPHGGYKGSPTPPKDRVQEVTVKRFEYYKG